MSKELFSLCDKVRVLREQLGFTQAELGRQLGVTRSSVNGWETGIAVPSTALIIELSKIFRVTTDYLLGVEGTRTIDASTLSPKEIAIIVALIQCLNSKEESTKKS